MSRAKLEGAIFSSLLSGLDQKSEAYPQSVPGILASEIDLHKTKLSDEVIIDCVYRYNPKTYPANVLTVETLYESTYAFVKCIMRGQSQVIREKCMSKFGCAIKLNSASM